jgi:hypothetical protein
MRHRAALLSAAVAATVLAGGVVLAVAAPQTIKLTSVQVTSKQSSKGFTGTDNVLQNGKKVGTDTLSCVFATSVCKVTVKLPKGSINARFVTKANATGGTLTITGGTGAYEGAKGTGSFQNLNKQGSRTAVTLNLK